MLSDSEAKTLAEARTILKGFAPAARSSVAEGSRPDAYSYGRIAQAGDAAHDAVTSLLSLMWAHFNDEKARAALDAE